MTIKFHCNHCGRRIEAPDKSGGKWGKCPACHSRVYIPDLSANPDELKLAPVDEEEQQRRERLMKETFELEQTILSERESPEEEQPSTGGSKVSSGKISDEQLQKSIVNYLRQMADGQLEKTKKTLNEIKPAAARAERIIDQIALADMPNPELSDIPPQVLSGMIRTLRQELKKNQ